MLITIIIPTFNSEIFLRKTLESLRSQQYKNFEIILIDGLSNDNTIKIVDEFSDIINIVISEKDFGMYDAINKGLKLSKGEIITYLNSDDYYNSNTLQSVIDYFTINKDISIVYGTIFYVDELDKIIKKVKPVKFNLKILISLWFCYIPQPCSFYRREVIDTIPEFDLQYKLASDYDFFVKASMFYKISLNENIFSYHRRHSNSLTTKYTEINRKETDSIRLKYLPNINGFYNRTFFIIYYFTLKLFS